MTLTVNKQRKLLKTETQIVPLTHTAGSDAELTHSAKKYRLHYVR